MFTNSGLLGTVTDSTSRMEQQQGGPPPGSIHAACLAGDAAALSLCLRSNPAAAVAEDAARGWTPVHWAAFYGQNICLHQLKEFCGKEILQIPTSQYKQRPLHVAASAGQAPCLAWLLQNDLEINGQDSFGETALHKAAAKGSVECAKLLISYGADLSTLNGSLGQWVNSIVGQNNGFGHSKQMTAHANGNAMADHNLFSGESLANGRQSHVHPNASLLDSFGQSNNCQNGSCTTRANGKRMSIADHCNNLLACPTRSGTDFAMDVDVGCRKEVSNGFVLHNIHVSHAQNGCILNGVNGLKRPITDFINSGIKRMKMAQVSPFSRGLSSMEAQAFSLGKGLPGLNALLAEQNAYHAHAYNGLLADMHGS